MIRGGGAKFTIGCPAFTHGGQVTFPTSSILSGHFTQAGDIVQKIVAFRINRIVRPECGDNPSGPGCTRQCPMMTQFVYCALSGGNHFYIKAV